mgnify:CR=1 FL=1
MSYYYTKTIEATLEEAEVKTREQLQAQGFGVLTEIDVSATLKNKIDVDFRPYKILGACNPPFAHKSLQAEDKIGLMLPCNVVLQEWGPGKVEVSVIDPLAAMEPVKNESLGEIAGQVADKLKKVIDSL